MIYCLSGQVYLKQQLNEKPISVLDSPTVFIGKMENKIDRERKYRERKLKVK